MRTITIDDERFAVNSLIRQLKTLDPKGEHVGVMQVDEFLEKIVESRYDIAFVDIDLRGMNGIALTKKVSDMLPELNIIIYSGHPEYKPDALDLYVSGYLVKPVYEDELKEALSHLRYPVKELSVRCYGIFEVFYGTEKVSFQRRDSKEVFAYLIDKCGSEVSGDELTELIFKDTADTDKKKNYLRNIIYDIRSTFSRYCDSEILLNTKGFYSVDMSKLKCDHYDYLTGRTAAMPKMDQYMEQYSSWSWHTKKSLFKLENKA